MKFKANAWHHVMSRKSNAGQWMGRLFSGQILLEFRLYPIQIIGSSDSLFPNKTNQPSSNMDATIFWNLFLFPINQTLQVFDVYLQWFPSCSSLKSIPFNFLAALTYQSQELCQVTQVHPSSAQPPAMTPHLWMSSAAVVKPPALRRTAPGDFNMVMLGDNFSDKNMFFFGDVCLQQELLRTNQVVYV